MNKGNYSGSWALIDNLINYNQIPENAVLGTYDYTYVFLSYIVSVIASKTAILVLQETRVSNFSLRLKGCLLGAFVMGAGIWSMHFTGMLAFKMSMEHSYQPGLTILSMVFAALFSLAVFYNITREKLETKILLINAPIMGIGVAVMHYTGMAAMDMRGETLYISSYFWLSILIAVAASAAAMWVMRFVNQAKKFKNTLGICAALIMGIAVCGMHYTGMAATIFVPYADCRFIDDQDQSVMVICVVLVSLLISLLGFFLTSRGFLKENLTKSKIFSMQGIIATNVLIIFIGLSISWFVYYESHRISINKTINFQEKKAILGGNTSKSIESILNTIYVKLKTMSNFPFVKDLKEHSPPLNEVNREILEQLVNELNAVDAMAVLHAWVDASGAFKGVSFLGAKGEAPSNSLSLEIKNILKTNEKIPIEDILKGQIKWFQENYPTQQKIEGGKIPAISDWITSPFSSASAAKKEDKAENFPIVYSLPIYNKEGQFSGIITSVISSQVFYNDLYRGESLLLATNQANHKFIYPVALSNHMRGSVDSIAKEIADPHLLYSTVLPVPVVDMKNKWKVWVGVNGAYYFQSESFKGLQDFQILGYSLALVMTVLAMGFFHIMRNSYKHEVEREVEANKSKSEFLSNMSHELRTPMHAILNYSAMGLKNSDSKNMDSLQKYFGNIQVAGSRLLSLLNNLLDLAKLESGKMQFNFTVNDFRLVIQETLRELESLLSEKHITPQVNYKCDSTNAVFDNDKMVQVLVNLLSNAIKFSNQDSQVYISVECVELPFNQGSELRCSVADEGVGLPENEVDLVFEKFIQSSNTKTKAGGTGLGLSICKQIVEAHGGTIWAKNREKVGAVFQFQFPKYNSLEEIGI